MNRGFIAAWSFTLVLSLVFVMAVSAAPEPEQDGGQKTGQKAREQREQAPIILKTMGSLLFGGTVHKAANGETFHGDHGYAQYYIPQQPRQYPLILWHGMGQSGRSWESTPDGREGFQALLTRKNWPVYIIDQPRRGRAGYTRAKPHDAQAAPTTARESSAWNAFRNGIWTPPQGATLFPGVLFPGDAASIDQFFRQQTPDTGEEPRTAAHRTFMGNSMAELLEQTGPAVLLTHSNSGQYGWFTGMATPDKVKAIVAYEPGQFVFPQGEDVPEVPYRNTLAGETLKGIVVPVEEFKKLTAMPILVIYGDNISTELSDIFNVEVWRIASTRARHFVDAVNRHGGKAQLVFLPKLGIRGNTHAPFADLNNVDIAAHLEAWLHSQHLDGQSVPHAGPRPRQHVKLSVPLQKP